MPTYLQPGQVTALHPSYVMHQQGVPHSLPLHVPSSHVGQFHSIPAMGSLQQWQNQQVLTNKNITSVIVGCQCSMNQQFLSMSYELVRVFFQAVSEGLQIATHNELPPSQTDQSMVRSDANYSYEMPVNGQALRQDYLDVHIGHGPNPDSEVLSSSGEAQVL